jgi:hypothetical protein
MQNREVNGAKNSTIQGMLNIREAVRLDSFITLFYALPSGLEGMKERCFS